MKKISKLKNTHIALGLSVVLVIFASSFFIIKSNKVSAVAAPTVHIQFGDDNDSSPDVPEDCPQHMGAMGTSTSDSNDPDCLRARITNPAGTEFTSDFRVCLRHSRGVRICTAYASQISGSPSITAMTSPQNGGTLDGTMTVEVETNGPGTGPFRNVSVGVAVAYQEDNNPCEYGAGMMWASQGNTSPWAYSHSDNDPGCFQVGLFTSLTPSYGSQYVSTTLPISPATVTASTSYSGNIVMRNTGNATGKWTSDTNTSSTNNCTAAPTALNQTCTDTFTVTSAAFKLQRTDTEPIVAPSNLSYSLTQTVTYRSSRTRDCIEVSIPRDDWFAKTLKFFNPNEALARGDCTLGPWIYEWQATSQTERDIVTNATATFPINMTMPATPGTYHLKYKMANEGQPFGEEVDLTFTIPAPAVNGVCSATHYNCTTGTSANNAENTYEWNWTCNGSNGGTNAQCSQAIPAPTNLTASCPSPGTSASFSWTLPAGYNDSYFRIRDVTTGGDRLYQFDIPEAVSQTGTSTTVPTTAGHEYEAWVHTRISPTSYSQSISRTFTCSATPSAWMNPYYSQCEIPNGASTCPKVVSWGTDNPIPGVTTAVTSATATPSPVNQNNSAGTTFTVPYGENWLNAYHNGALLGQAQIDGICIPGSPGSVYFNGTCRAPVTVTASINGAANGTITPASQNVVYSSPAVLTIVANSGYSKAITGTCPAGTWNGNQYSTGLVTSNCTVVVTFTAIACPNGATNPPACTICPPGQAMINGTCTPVTVSVTATTPYNTTPGGTVNFAYNPTTNSGTTDCRLLDNNNVPLTSYQPSAPIDPSISYSAANGIGSYSYRIECRNNPTNSATGTSNLITVNTACGAGSTWNGTSCVPNALPIVISPTATSITTTSATLGANVTSIGSPGPLSSRGTCWGTAPNPTTNCLDEGTAPEGGYTTGVFSHSRNGFTAGVTYYYRGYANNAFGRGYSPSATFTATNNPSGTISASNCVIASGAGSCNSSITWSTTNPLPGVSSSVTTPTNITVGTGNSGSASYQVSPPGRTFYLYHNGVLIDQATSTPTCSVGNTWNGTICVARPIVTVTATPDSVPYNGSSTISWTAPTATSCTYNGSPVAAPSGSFSTGPLQVSTIYTIYCNNVAGTGSESASVAVAGSPYGTLEAGTCTISIGASTCTSLLAVTTGNLNAPDSSNTAITRNPAGACTNCTYPFTSPVRASVSYETTQFFLFHRGALLAIDTVTPTCAVGSAWDGTICLVNSTPSGTLSATNCTIAIGASTCPASVSWTTANLDNKSQTAITRNTGTPASFVPSPVASGSQAVTLGYGINGVTTFYLYHNAQLLAQTNSLSGVATCAPGSTWNGTICAPNTTPSGTIDASSCTIDLGASTCITTLSVTTANLNAPDSTNTAITRNPDGTCNNCTYPFGSRTTAVVGYTTTNFFLYHRAVLLAQDSVTPTCVSGTGWDGDSCESLSNPVDGACATPPNGGTYSEAPIGKLCDAGTANPASLSGSGPWNWVCEGIDGGKDQSCSASQSAPSCATIDANPTSIYSGGSTTLTWSADKCASSCTGINFDTGGRPAGTASVAPSVNTTYAIDCEGNIDSVNVSVKRKPIFIEN